MLNDRVIFIDGAAIVVDKPSGLPVDPPRDGSLSVENHLASLAFGFQRWPTPVHRLDRDTSGCLLLARNPKAHRRFAQAFEAGRVTKEYLAVVEGVPAEAEGTIALSLSKISTRESGWRIILARKGQPAVTHWIRIAVNGQRSLILFRPETGRTHQLRVHAASGLGMPIVGDPVYGTGGEPMLLHASRIRMEREGKKPVEAAAALPESFAKAGFAYAVEGANGPVDTGVAPVESDG